MKKVLIIICLIITKLTLSSGQNQIDSMYYHFKSELQKESIKFQEESYILKKENLDLKNRLLVNRYIYVLFPTLLILGILSSFFMASIYFRNTNGKLLSEIRNLEKELKKRNKDLETSKNVIKEITHNRYN